MTMDLFHQFTPNIIPLTVMLLLPLTVLLPYSFQWLGGRIVTLKIWIIKQLTSQILSPLSRVGHKWALVLMALIVFLMTLNVLGMLPYTFTPTTQLAVNLGFAIPLWLATITLGARKKPVQFTAHVLPLGTPLPLIPVLVLIETVSMIVRPFALGVRITANLVAGHLLIQLSSMATASLVSSTLVAAVLVSSTVVLLTALEVAVALIQAYVYVLLVSLYLKENT
uniref:ATP synthase subunit a n=1 Tax=Neocyema erythrosoma TaxID=2024705 RepID=A0A347ZJT2_9TELE|nr:ATP synthase F0 subunit 6 [Neocyema erythrosoma]BBA85497.1 ATPase subunits 6 [Neocyema erythrosoma]